MQITSLFLIWQVIRATMISPVKSEHAWRTHTLMPWCDKLNSGENTRTLTQILSHPGNKRPTIGSQGKRVGVHSCKGLLMTDTTHRICRKLDHQGHRGRYKVPQGFLKTSCFLSEEIAHESCYHYFQRYAVFNCLCVRNSCHWSKFPIFYSKYRVS